jgi:hypothetical protein
MWQKIEKIIQEQNREARHPNSNQPTHAYALSALAALSDSMATKR